MSPVIRLPKDIYERLGNHANGFEAPASVIKRLLDEAEGVDPSERAATETTARDMSKYEFEGQSYGKGRLVLAVIRHHVAGHPQISFEQLQTAFPDDLQGSVGVLATYEDAMAIRERDRARHFLKPDEAIDIEGERIAVSREWGRGNIDNFLRRALELGYNVEQAS